MYVADALAAPRGRAKSLALELVSALLRGMASELASDVKCRLTIARENSGAACDIAQLAREALLAFSEEFSR